MDDTVESHPDPSTRAWAWATLPVLASLVALRGLFGTSGVFYLRDLSEYFWPYFVGVRRAEAAGRSVMWDPSAGFGRSLAADPLPQVFFPPAALLRLLPSEALGFNLYVGLPFPIAALGCFAFLRRYVSPPAASVGAVVFALSGPTLSCGYMPNLSWALAFIPWILWAADRVTRRPKATAFVALSALFALQCLAGEPVVLTGTAVLALVLRVADPAVELADLRARGAAALRVLAAGAAAALLCAPQLLMLFDAASRSYRTLGDESTRRGISFHPLHLLEAVAPQLFGDMNQGDPGRVPFLRAFGGGANPWIYCAFFGVGALVLVASGVLAKHRRRWVAFWLIVLGSALLLAIGDNTPLFDLLRKLPFVSAFRSPSKYLVFVPLALAAVGAAGWAALAEGTARLTRTIAVAGALAAVGALAVLLALAAPAFVQTELARLAVSVGVGIDFAGEAGRLLAEALAPAGARLLGISLAALAALLLYRFVPERRPLALLLLYVVVAGDLLLAGLSLNPTLPVAALDEPEWAQIARAGGGRVYTAAKLITVLGAPPDVDRLNLGTVGLPPGLSPTTYYVAAFSQIAPIPLAWDLREAISYDATLLAPREYSETLAAFRSASPDARAFFLSRVGVRYYLLTHEPAIPARRVYTDSILPTLALYEAAPPAPRAVVVPGYAVEPDVSLRCRALFRPDLDPGVVVLLPAEPPAPAGAPAAGAGPTAEIMADEPVDVRVRADVPDGGGFLVLKDSYDPNWRVEVDGAPAPLLQVDGIFRGVRLAAGEHAVRFRYAPRPWYVGVGVATATALGLLALVVLDTLVRRRRARVPDPPTPTV